MSTNTFTGRQRHRQTGRSVRIVDRLARGLIAVGGIGTVVAVSTVFIFLVWVVVPLFLPATAGAARRLPSAAAANAQYLGIDDYRSLAWTLTPDAVLRSLRLDTGEAIAERPLFPESQPTAMTLGAGGREVVCGFADGSVRIVRVGFTTSFPAVTDLPAEAQQAPRDKPVVVGEGLLTSTTQGQLRLQTVRASISEPLVSAGSAAIRLVDCSKRPTGTVCCYLDANDRLAVHAVRQRQNLLRQTTKSDVVDVDLPFEARASQGPPKYLLLAGQGDNLYLIWDDGHLVRYDLRDLSHPRLAEQLDLLSDSAATVTAAKFLTGKTTLVIGDSQGYVRAWFPTKPTEAHTNDGTRLVAAHEFAGSTAVSSLAPSLRGRQLAVAYADGTLRLLQITSGLQLLAIADQTAVACNPIAMSPKSDALIAVAGDALVEWPISLGYPEVSLATLFRPVWYESYDNPSNVWQSSGGGDDFEPKLGMLPLVFGTVKATFYSLLFAVPLALFSAIYTSEFLHARARARIKPAIEMMASLPSVVLGFVAALVVAPFVEQVIPAIIAGVFVVPCTFLFAAYLWQLLPQRAGLVLTRWRFAFICATLPIAVFFAALLGPTVERILFGGDLRSWLDRQTGSGVGGWVVMLLPLAALTASLFTARRVNPYLRQALRGASRQQRAIVELLKFVVAAAATLLAAWGVALLLDSLHLDPRGLVLQTYVQRNALVVGFVMGFAIVPLIYTIADDALSTVPGHLRSASLGAGATPWQTAVRVIIPTAMSGLFSAVMIGLGRAVGETMIVLMAAGNTPIMDWNVFNGFQTLSASIATELPEAVQGSAHYRTLFVAALALFAITFVINTIAEGVRLRFRRRAHEL